MVLYIHSLTTISSFSLLVCFLLIPEDYYSGAGAWEIAQFS